jgi:hypothetical protein
MFDKSPMMQRFYSHPAGPILSMVAGWTFLFFWLPHCFMPFAILKFDKYWPGRKTEFDKFGHYRATLLIMKLFHWTIFFFLKQISQNN